jgi:hypothetical protein
MRRGGHRWPLEPLRRIRMGAAEKAGREAAATRREADRAGEAAARARTRAEEARRDAARPGRIAGPSTGEALARDALARLAADHLARRVGAAAEAASAAASAAGERAGDSALTFQRARARADALDRAAERWSAGWALRRAAGEEREAEEAWSGRAGAPGGP